MWIIIGFALLFILTLMMKTPNVSNEDIQLIRADRLKQQADRKRLEQTDHREFEYIVADVFRQLGYKAEVTKATGDGGKDILLWKNDEFAVAEVKRYTKGTVGRPLIQKLHSAMIDSNAHKGYFVTLSQFNKNAREYALRHGIELVDGDELIRLMNA